MIVFFCHCLPFLLSELSCGVHAVLAIGEWGEQSASVVCTIDRTDLLQFLLACCEIVEVLELCDKFLVVVAADSNNLSKDLDGLCGLCCVFYFSFLSAPLGLGV